MITSSKEATFESVSNQPFDLTKRNLARPQNLGKVSIPFQKTKPSGSALYTQWLNVEQA